MARSSAPPRSRGRLFRWLERTLLGAAMSVAAVVVERRLIKAMKAGNVKPAPRTGDTPEPIRESLGVDPVPEGGLGFGGTRNGSTPPG